MPRPKRSKVPSSANFTPRAGPVPKDSQPAVRKTVPEDIEDDSDRGQNAIISVRRIPKTKGKAVDARKTSTSSSLRKGNGRGMNAAQVSGAEDDGNKVEEAQDQEASTPSIEMSRREATTPPTVSVVFRKDKQSASHTAAHKPQKAYDIVSSIESDIAAAPVTLPRMENTILAQPTFRGRARQRAPSILGKGAEAARARSSSMGLEMTGAGGSSEPGTTQSTRFSMIGGNFKRRQRQPSLLGSNRKKMLLRQELEQANQGLNNDEDADKDSEDFNDFNPDDESTPLHLQKTKTILARNHSPSTAPVSTSSTSRKRRKISEIQVPRSPTLQRSTPPLHPDEDIYGVSPSPAIRSRPAAVHTVRSPLPAEEDIYGVSSPIRRRQVESPVIQQTQSHSRSITPVDGSPVPGGELPFSHFAGTPEALSETNAPPRSSSPVTPTFPRTNLSTVQQQGLNVSRRRQILATQDSPISSPPSLTHSPNYKTTTKPATRRQTGKKSKAEVPLTTAALQNLLPQRRRRRGRRERDEFDMTSSDVDEIDISGLRADDDELSYLNAPARRGRTRTPGAEKGRFKTSAHAPANATTKRKARQNAKTPTTSSTVKNTQKSKRTYGSTSANKENDGGDDEAEEDEAEEEDDSLLPDANETPEDENSQELEERIGKELKRLKRKFEVVDQWEMEFEDVEANSSEDRRMADAR